MVLRREIDVGVRADASQFLAEFARMQGAMRAMSAEAAGLSGKSFLSAGLAGEALAAGAAFELTAGQAIHFGDTMIDVNTKLGLSESSLHQVGQEVLDLSTKMPQSAEALARGLGLAAQAGFSVSDSMKVTEQSAKLATAGLTDQATATRAITSVLNAYNEGVGNSAHVSDVLFEASKLGAGSVGQVADAIRSAAAVAAGAHIPIEDLAAALATMGRQGVDASAATQGLPRLIKAIVDPSEAMAGVLHAAGYESGALALQQDGLAGVMAKLGGIIGDNVQAFEALFPNVRQQRIAFALMSQDGQTFLQIQQQLKGELNGATERAYAQEMQSVGNEIKVTANQAKEFGITFGAAMEPAISGAVRGLGGLFTLLRGGAEFLAQHKVIVEALAVVYGGRLALSLLLLIANQAGVAAGWLAVQASELIATAATEGLAAAMGSLLLLAAPVALALGAVFAVRSWQDAKKAADDYVASLEKGKDAATPQGRADINQSLAEGTRTFEASHKVASGWLQTIQAGAETIIPFFGHGLRDAQLQTDALTKAQEENAKASENETDNLLAVHQATGLSIDAIRQKAKAMGIDLTGAFGDSQSERQALIDDIDNIKKSLDLSDAEISAWGDDAVTKIKAIQDAMANAGKAFDSAFAQPPELADPKKAAEDLVNAQDSLAAAKDRVASAEDRIRKNQEYLVRTPERDAELANAKRDLARAEEEERKAQEKVSDARKKAVSPAQSIEEQYRKQVQDATNFYRNIDIAAKKGVDPQFLAEALADPQKYAPILDAIAKDTTGQLVKSINDAFSQLGTLRDRGEVIAAKIQEGIESGFKTLPDLITNQLDHALSDPASKVHAQANLLGQSIGQGIAQGVQQGLQQGADYGYPGAKYDIFPGGGGGGFGGTGSSGDFGPTSTLGAHGHVLGDITEAHIAHSELVRYAEPGTGGEAYIPMGTAYRGRSELILAEVAHRFGYDLLRGSAVHMQDGGFMPDDHAWLRAPGNVVHLLRDTSRVEIHHHSQRGGDTNIDKLVAHDYHDFNRQMRERQQLDALVGM